MLEQRGAARTAIRRTYDASETGSIRVRHPRDRMRLDELGTQIAVLELQGDLLFAEAEKVSRHVLKGRDGTKFFVLDFRRLFRIDAVGFEILAALDRTLKASGQHLIIAGARSNIMAGSRGKFPTPDDETAQPVPRWFATVDAALEYLEDHLLGAEPPASLRPGTVGIDGFEILQNLTCAERTTLMAFLHARPFSEGETLVEIGTPSDGLYFVVSGRVDVTVPLDSAHADYRVNTIDEGNVFGELAIFESQARTANVVAATGGEVLILSPEDLKNLFDNEPDIYRQLVMAVGRSLAERLRRATEEIRALAR
jgi:anti-anti-sigma regulatory factor